MASIKYRSSPATQEQTTPQSASPFSSLRRLWPAARQTGTVPSKKARHVSAETPAHSVTPSAGFITSVSATAPRASPRMPRSAAEDDAKRNLSQDFEAVAPKGSKLFGLFSPMFSLFAKQQKEAAQVQSTPAVADEQMGEETTAQEQTQQEESATPAVATPARRNSNVPAFEGEEESDSDEEMGDWDDETNPYAFIRRLPFLPRQQPPMSVAIAAKSANAPKPTLVLDLDETLVHCSTEPVSGADVVFPVVWNGIEYRVYARRRPGLEAFMEAVSELFEIVVFTASQQVYADKLLDILDPQKRWFKHRVFRDACVCVEGNYLKDLSILGRDLSRTIIIDNSPQAFGFQYNNGIPILSWFDAADDAELAKLLPLLRSLSGVPDVRPVLRSHFKLYKRIERRV